MRIYCSQFVSWPVQLSQISHTIILGSFWFQSRDLRIQRPGFCSQLQEGVLYCRQSKAHRISDPGFTPSSGWGHNLRKQGRGQTVRTHLETVVWPSGQKRGFQSPKSQVLLSTLRGPDGKLLKQGVRTQDCLDPNSPTLGYYYHRRTEPRLDTASDSQCDLRQTNYFIALPQFNHL